MTVHSTPWRSRTTAPPRQGGKGVREFRTVMNRLPGNRPPRLTHIGLSGAGGKARPRREAPRSSLERDRPSRSEIASAGLAR